MSHAYHPALRAGNAAVITGAASGIGLATAKRFAALGLRVCLADQNRESLETALAVLGESDDVFAHPTDVSDPGSVDALADEVDAQLVVMGTRGLTGIDHLLVGSVAEKVVRISKIPVLTVH